MVGSMALTLLATQTASCGAHIQHPADDLLVRASPAGGYRASRIADVGTVQVQADTLSQVMNIVLSETCICTGRTYLSAGVALLDAPDERIIGASPNIRMSCNHLLGLHGVLRGEWRVQTAAGTQTFTFITCSQRDEGSPSQIVQDRAIGSLVPVTSIRELLDRPLKLTQRLDLRL
jgi:hypothetical protein